MSDDTPTVEKPAEGAQPAPAGKPSALPEAEITRLTDEIVTALKTVYDPEIPADIYEIGLIYRIDIADDRTVKVRHVADLAQLPVGAGTAGDGARRSFDRVGSGKSRCQRGLGPALGPEPDVGRGARRPQHVLSYLFDPKPPCAQGGARRRRDRARSPPRAKSRPGRLALPRRFLTPSLPVRSKIAPPVRFGKKLPPTALTSLRPARHR